MATKIPPSTTPIPNPPPIAPDAVTAPKKPAPLTPVDGVDTTAKPVDLSGPKTVGKLSVPGVKESFPLEALAKIGQTGTSGLSFMLDAGSLRGLKLQIRRVTDGDAKGFEVLFQITEGKLAGLIDRIAKKDGVKRASVEFRGVEASEDGNAKYTSAKGAISGGSSHAPKDLDSGANQWSYAWTDTKGAQIEVVHGKAALALRGLTRIHLRGDDAACTAQLQAVLNSLGLQSVFAPPTPKSKQLNTLMRALWQADHAEATKLSADLDKLKPEEVREALKKAGYSDERIDGLRYEEVFKGHFTVVDAVQAREMALAGARYLYSTVTDPAHVHSILTDGQKASVQRYKDGLIINGMSTNADFVTGGATGVFTRLVTQDAIYAEHGWAGRTYKLVQSFEQLGRTDWYGWNGDFYGRRWELDTKTNFGLELLKKIDNNGSYQAYNELIFTAGNRPENIERVVATNEADRQKLIDHLKEKGYTPHNGLSIEDFVVLAPKLMVYGPSPFKDVSDLAAFGTDAIAKAKDKVLGPLQWLLYEAPASPEKAEVERKILLDGPAEARAVLFKAGKLNGKITLSGEELGATIEAMKASESPEAKAALTALPKELAEALFVADHPACLALLKEEKVKSSGNYYGYGRGPLGLTDDSYVRILERLAAKQAPGSAKSASFELAVELSAERLLQNNHAGFHAFLEKHPLITPADPQAWVAENIEKLKTDAQGVGPLLTYAAQLKEPKAIGALQLALIEANNASAVKILQSQLQKEHKLHIPRAKLAATLESLGASSPTRSHLVQNEAAALAAYADPAIHAILKAHYSTSYNQNFGLYGDAWPKLVEAQLERTKGQITDVVRETMELGGTALLGNKEFKEKFAKLEGLYAFEDAAAFVKQAAGEATNGKPGALKLAWMLLGPVPAAARMAALTECLSSTNYQVTDVLTHARDEKGQLAISPADLRSLVNALADANVTQAVNSLVGNHGPQLLRAIDAPTLEKLKPLIEKHNKDDVTSAFGLYHQQLVDVLVELEAGGEATKPIFDYLLKKGLKSALASSAKELYDFLESRKLGPAALGKDVDWSVELIRQSATNYQYYWAILWVEMQQGQPGYASYPEYNTMPRAITWALKGGGSTWDDAALAGVEAKIKSWNWSTPAFEKFLSMAEGLSEEWKAKLTAAHKG